MDGEPLWWTSELKQKPEVLGETYFLRLQNLRKSSPFITPVAAESSEEKYFVKCVYCGKNTELLGGSSLLGQEISCSTCGMELKITPFVAKNYENTED